MATMSNGLVVVVRVMFVGTGPSTYLKRTNKEWSSLDALCREVSVELAAYLQRNKYDWTLIEDRGDGAVMLDWNDHDASSFHHRFQAELRERGLIDLHESDLNEKRNFALLADEIRRLFPSSSGGSSYELRWSSCDPQNQDERDTVPFLKQWNEARNQEFEKATGMKRTFGRHYQQSWQHWLLGQESVYDLLWFFGCCTPEYVFTDHIARGQDAHTKLHALVAPTGYVLYADPFYSGPDLFLCDVDARLATRVGIDETLVAKTSAVVNQVLLKQEKLGNGVYTVRPPRTLNCSKSLK